MSRYLEFIKKRDEIVAEMTAAFELEKQQAITEIRERIEEYGIDISELAPGKKGRGKGNTDAPKDRLPPKYRDPDSGNTWSGRGRTPKWLIGQDLARFAV